MTTAGMKEMNTTQSLMNTFNNSGNTKEQTGKRRRRRRRRRRRKMLKYIKESAVRTDAKSPHTRRGWRFRVFYWP